MKSLRTGGGRCLSWLPWTLRDRTRVEGGGLGVWSLRDLGSDPQTYPLRLCVLGLSGPWFPCMR